MLLHWQTGGWVVAWESPGQDSLYSSGIFQQHFAADGNRLGVETQVNTSFSGFDQTAPSMRALPDGGWLVFWTTEANIGGNVDIAARRYLSNGLAYGDDFFVNTYFPGRQLNPQATLLEDGTIVVTWQSHPDLPDEFVGSGHDGSSGGIVQARFVVDPIFAGTAGADTITGSARNEGAFGYAGTYMIYGQADNDTLDGGTGNDALCGGNGNDLLTGSIGNDRIDGGLGSDRAYFTGTVAATVSLAIQTAQVTGHGTDILAGIEHLSSGSGNDRLTGDAFGNSPLSGAGSDTVNGGVGNDTVDGGAGNDALYGGDGNDLMFGGIGNNRIDGGLGSDRAYFTGTVAATVNLSILTAQVTGYGTDTLAGIEQLSSGSGNDKLTGDAIGNSLVSGAGNDMVNGGAGNDALYGGVGNDLLGVLAMTGSLMPRKPKLATECLTSSQLTTVLCSVPLGSTCFRPEVSAIWHLEC